MALSCGVVDARTPRDHGERIRQQEQAMAVKDTIKTIARSNRRFTKQLNRWNNYLADGNWKPTYHSMSYVDGDEIINAGGGNNFRDARNYTLDFDILTNSQLAATRTFTKDGTTYTQDYIGMVDPWAKEFLMWSVDGTDQMLGTLTPKEDAFTILLAGPGHIWDRVYATVNFVDVS
ncbi:hypothetical protein [Synechococcus sp. CBW1107]|jgi:hypothetical protein|uniref:hypothetical protein n=1 Tax=Synechococcus sp. CBW1107 TaxID=2789857 RepID=UPI002AD3060A|nr:hypothetical protein [Synechococcus sp. CBW1107]CAK6686743.1 hypothetical protein MNNICLKF_00077 [Synechococcus sp. CBW1107]